MIKFQNFNSALSFKTNCPICGYDKFASDWYNYYYDDKDYISFEIDFYEEIVMHKETNRIISFNFINDVKSIYINSLKSCFSKHENCYEYNFGIMVDFKQQKATSIYLTSETLYYEINNHKHKIKNNYHENITSIYDVKNKLLLEIPIIHFDFNNLNDYIFKIKTMLIFS